MERLVLIDGSVYAEGTGNMTKLPKAVAYAGVRCCMVLLIHVYFGYVMRKLILLHGLSSFGS